MFLITTLLEIRPSVGQMTPTANDDASTGEFVRSVSASSAKSPGGGGGGGGGGERGGSIGRSPGREEARSAGADFANGRRTPKSPAANRRSQSGKISQFISPFFIERLIDLLFD